VKTDDVCRFGDGGDEEGQGLTKRRLDADVPEGLPHMHLHARSPYRVQELAIVLFLSPSPSMFSRLSQLARHLIRPLPNYAYRSAACNRRSVNLSRTGSPVMTTDKKLIHTAGCIIIGDEVLGGKV